MARIQLRRDTSSNWQTNNPTPSLGEPCYETDTKKLKIGDGVTKYNDLQYFAGGTGGTTDYTQLTNKPQINGIELTGNKNGNDLGLANESEIEELGNELNQLANNVTNLDTNKQNKLTAGTNITIEGDVISATGGGGTIAYIDGGNAQTDEPAVLKASNVDLGVYPKNNIYSTNENITIE